MSMTLPDLPGRRAPSSAAAALCAVELLLLSVTYKHGYDFVCRDVLPTVFCAFLGEIVPRALGVLAALSLFFLARPAARTALAAAAPTPAAGIAVNLAGFGLALVPWALNGVVALPPALLALCWSVAAVAIVGGLALCLSGVAGWRVLARRHGPVLVALVALGAALPEMSAGLFGLWRIEIVTEVTFASVLFVLATFGYPATSNVEWKQIAHEDFAILVGPQCSGVEGFALITLFVAVFLALFRKDLRFPHALLLLPVGLALSWSFNVLRISVLFILGVEVSPELAVGGFHSHAGWLAFTILSTGLIAVAYNTPFFRACEAAVAVTPKAAAALPPLRMDPVAARILPFAVFMLSALVASTFVELPSLVYPLRALIVTAALAMFWPLIAALPWRLDPLALGSGVACGLLWVFTAAPPSGEDAALADALTAMPAALLALWVVSRVIGTAVLVPLVEELFFRGYAQDRLTELLSRAGPVLATICAVAISSVLFGLLHDRWLAGILAGVLFGLIYLRRRNLTAAILSHAAANVVIAAAALVTGDWSLI